MKHSDYFAATSRHSNFFGFLFRNFISLFTNMNFSLILSFECVCISLEYVLYKIHFSLIFPIKIGLIIEKCSPLEAVGFLSFPENHLPPSFLFYFLRTPLYEPYIALPQQIIIPWFFWIFFNFCWGYCITNFQMNNHIAAKYTVTKA